MRAGLFTIWILLMEALCGCSELAPVQPWEKGVLALSEMGFDPDPQEAAFAAQIQASKEAASGTATAGASGCGCN